MLIGVDQTKSHIGSVGLSVFLLVCVEYRTVKFYNVNWLLKVIYCSYCSKRMYRNTFQVYSL